MKTSKGLVVPADGGQRLDMSAPGRWAALKLLAHETNDSIMLFVLFLYTPAAAGGYVEELLNRSGSMIPNPL